MKPFESDEKSRAPRKSGSRTAYSALHWIARGLFVVGALIDILGYFTPGATDDATVASTNICVIALGMYLLFRRPRYYSRRRRTGTEEKGARECC